MTRPAVRIRNIGKQYQLGMKARRYKTLRDSIVETLRAPWRRLRHLSGADSEGLFWALKDINLDVAPGEVLGIIGHNGAGKSTLLKILSRITEPTTGEIEVDGRVGSLLEVGTGFHPELSGRENIFVNGAILGMSRAEVQSRFDEIVAFSGVEEFLDTPVKRYSSGMVVRLAFAVAAHLEPEILVVDEVLAVGDAEFQNKCLGKMGDVANSGRTVLLVSHNMAAVESLCRRACLLEAGELKAVGDVGDVVRRYLDSTSNLSGDIDLEGHGGRPPGMTPVFRRLVIRDGDGCVSPAVRIGGSLRFEFEMHSKQPLHARTLGLKIIDSRGLAVIVVQSGRSFNEQLTIHGDSLAACTIRNIRLTPGRYQLRFFLKTGRNYLDEIRSNVEFEVLPLHDGSAEGMSRSRKGVIVPEMQWDLQGEPLAAAVAVSD